MNVELKTFLESKTDLPVFVEDEPTSNTAVSFLSIKSTVTGTEFSEYQDMTVEAYADSTANAWNLINEVKEWMTDFIDNSKVASIRLNTIYKDNDVTKKRYRYRGVWRVQLF